MKQTTVFEGFFDQGTGSDRDVAVVMVKPILGYTESTSGPAGVNEIVEEWWISRFMKLDENGKGIGTDDDFYCKMDDKKRPRAEKQLALAKEGRAEEGFFYWRQVIEWDDDYEAESYKVMEDVCYDRRRPVA